MLAVVLLNVWREAGKFVTHWDCISVLLVQFQSRGGKLVFVYVHVVGSEQSSDQSGAGCAEEAELLTTTELDFYFISILCSFNGALCCAVTRLKVNTAINNGKILFISWMCLFNIFSQI